MIVEKLPANDYKIVASCFERRVTHSGGTCFIEDAADMLNNGTSPNNVPKNGLCEKCGRYIKLTIKPK